MCQTLLLFNISQSIFPVHMALASRRSMGRTDGLTDARPLHRPFSVSSVHGAAARRSAANSPAAVLLRSNDGTDGRTDGRIVTQTLHWILRASINLLTYLQRWLGSRVVGVLVSGAEGPGFKSQPRRCQVLGKLFTPIVPLFTKQQNW